MERFRERGPGRLRLLLASGLVGVLAVAALAGVSYALPGKDKPKPAAAQQQASADHDGKTRWRSTLRASDPTGPVVRGVSPSTVDWNAKKGRVDLKAGSDVRVKVKVKDLQPSAGSVPAIAVAVYCGSTLAATVPATLSSGDLRVHTVVSVATPCFDPSLLVLDTTADPDRYIAAPVLG